MLKYTLNDNAFLLTKNQKDALDILLSTNGGGFATVHGYVSTSKRITPEKADITFISRFSYSRLLERKLKALQEMDFSDVIKSDAFKRSEISTAKKTTEELQDIFTARKAYLIESAQKTMDGDRADAHRQAHDRCYVRLDNGIRIHYKTVEVNKIKEPVMVDGLPIAESIILDMIQVSKKIIEPGEYKPVKSGLPVLMGNVIESLMPMSTKFKALSLKSDNFDSLTIANAELLPADIKGIFN